MPFDEASRLKELHALELECSVSQLEFDNLTQLAGQICDAPVAMISFVDQNIVWFKSRVGFNAPQAPREHAFCNHVIAGVAPMIVEDASADPRFQKNEFVRGPRGVRFYAGVPLVLGSGFVVGTLCVMDYKVRTLSEKELNSLAKLAGQVIALIEARRTQLRLLMQESSRLVSEERLDFALKAAEIGDWDMDLRTNVARRSFLHDRCFGYTEAVPVWGYDTFLAHIFEADRARVDGCYQRAMAGQGAYDVEFRVVWPDQTVHWLWSKGRFYFDDEGKPNRVAGILVDITERKKLDAALRESDYRWRFAIEGAGDGLWDWDIQNDHVFYSETWKSILGLEKDEVGTTPMVWSTRLHPDDKDRVVAEVQSHLDGQTAQYASEHRVICKDGSAKWALGRGLVVQRDVSGKPLRMIGTNSDITDRKQAQLALQSSNAQLKLLETCISRLNDIVLITEAEPIGEPGPRIVFVNEAFERRTGFTREEVIGNSPRMLQGPNTDRHELDRIRAALERWEPVRAELLNYTKSGQEFWIELDIVPVADATGWYTHWVAVERDVTGRKQIQKDLQASVKDKEALLMEVHHRVKNNLQVITSLLRMEAHRSQQADTKAMLTDMQGRIRSMALLHKALYRSGTFASADLGSYLQQVASQAFGAQSQSADLVRLTLRLGSIEVGMDQAISAGLLVNELISNCLKHAFPQQRAGEVSVVFQPLDADAEAADPQWSLCISDTGVGLPPDFEQRRKTSLGLQLVDDLGQQIGGSLMIESQPGQGAQFTLIFTALAPKSLVMPL